jgi:hypothetical protein
MPPPQSVQVLEEKTVAGFHAVVLEATSANALVGWLKEHGYAFSPEVEAWAKPYVDGGWKITALRVATDAALKDQKGVAAAALRISFKTDQPLFPYREPESTGAAQKLGASSRLLRIYFVSDARYDGALTKDVAWTGRPVWSNELTHESRARLLELLSVPETSVAGEPWLTEFEDEWPYRKAPSDLTFARALHQHTLKRPPIIEYTQNDAPNMTWPLVFAGVIAAPALAKRMRRK